ncbi:MAG: tRNA (N6-isopentenyl adenosine(37)-C2)-methylthiotransferase MiaB [Lachnospiraceae bacterium]|nr:tRNA (N6-isopentenyl adenosine(37)-C2)-methylthiotransferase MiaB [Lachnospiraceae bacterium]
MIDFDLNTVFTDGNPPDKEPERQYYFMGKCRERVSLWKDKLGRTPRYHVETFGCQMNFKDSEKLEGVLAAIGFEPEESEKADIVIYNTCTVRENANTKVYGRIGYLGKLKSKDPDMIIALCGCMMQEPQAVEKIKNSYRFVDLIFGTHNIYKLAELLWTVFSEKSFDRADAKENAGKAAASHRSKHRTIIDVWKDTSDIVEELPSVLKYKFKAGVNIMFGCNNFCTYCIVPYVRGRERSRKYADIINEIRDMVAHGVVEIMLLGQNVNSYGKGLEDSISFAELLKRVDDIEGLKRIRFMTSHPKDLSDDLIDVMAHSKHICRHIHLPVQSGSDRLLKAMNRHYTSADYLKITDKLRKAMPDIAITTDIIVGFPGETEEDFCDTLKLCEKVGFDNAFTFIYSKRTGTPAAAMEDQIPEDVVKERFNRLLEMIKRSSEEKASALTGRTVEVLVEETDYEKKDLSDDPNGKMEISDHSSAVESDSRKPYVPLTGRLENNLLVHFTGCKEMIGSLVNVRLDECKGFYFTGSLA